MNAARFAGAPGAPDEKLPVRLVVRSGGFLTQRRLRRILALAGHEIALGRPREGDAVAVWGRSPTAWRGERLAARAGLPLLRVEDAFLRSVEPGRLGAPPIGLALDWRGVHFDSSAPSDLETLLATHPLDDTPTLDRARAAIGWMRAAHLSKYTAFDPEREPPAPGYVLVIDQTLGDASVRWGGASPATFAAMLSEAREAHPGARILVKTHPETAAGLRPGHFGPADFTGGAAPFAEPVSPWALLEGAIAVYTVSSQLGFEAILAGHRPRVFGQPFYAGWGLTEDRAPVPRRGRRLTAAQLFAAAMIFYPLWYDPCRDRLCTLEEALAQFEAETRAWRDDRRGWVASGMRLWKRGALQCFFGRQRRVRFADPPARAARIAARTGRRAMVWASAADEDARSAGMALVEDGFLRSRGLGAELVPPLSLVTDSRGIYYDPTRESTLERLVSEPLPAHARRRAEALVAALREARVSKYNLSGVAVPDLAARGGAPRILVPGQVEDDASIRLGAGEVRTNLGLLSAARAANPGATLVYKPHPDVEAGLRPGAVPEAEALELADVVAAHADPVALLAAVDEVWTISSQLGFEALVRGVAVTCLGAPFYAGWGLTRDLGPVPARRAGHRPGLDALVHAALVAYPRYRDPVSGLPCPPELAIERLAHGPDAPRGPANRVLSKLQGRLASFAPLWR